MTVSWSAGCREGMMGGNVNMDEALIYEILSVVEEIPPGKVATYG